MDQRYTGLIFILTLQSQAGYFTTYLERGWKYTDVISDVDLSISPLELALVSLDALHITFICLLRNRGRIATRKCKVDFEQIRELDKPIPISQLRNSLPSKLHKHFERVVKTGTHRFPKKTWTELVSILHGQFSDAYLVLDELDKLRRFRSSSYSGIGTEILSQEKDAVNLVLRFAGFDHTLVKEWFPPNEEIAPFLKGLSAATIREDTMVHHDSVSFGEWRPQRHDRIGSVTLVKDKEMLTILNVNRTPIEETLGVDLIYYHHKYRSYTLVQYKRMKTEKRPYVGNGEEIEMTRDVWVYRPFLDPSYKKEIARMKEFQKQLPRKDNGQSLPNYRLNDQAFYFKLCPNEQINPNSTDMIRGMYFPLDYWNRLLSSTQTCGPKGGKQVTYQNSGRYLTNTFFVNLVQSGWIGTREITSKTLNNLINEILSSGRAIVLGKVEPRKENRVKDE